MSFFASQYECSTGIIIFCIQINLWMTQEQFDNTFMSMVTSIHKSSISIIIFCIQINVRFLSELSRSKCLTVLPDRIFQSVPKYVQKRHFLICSANWSHPPFGKVQKALPDYLFRIQPNLFQNPNFPNFLVEKSKIEEINFFISFLEHCRKEKQDSKWWSLTFPLWIMRYIMGVCVCKLLTHAMLNVNVSTFTISRYFCSFFSILVNSKGGCINTWISP